MSDRLELVLSADVAPLVSFTELLQGALHVREGSLDFGDLPLELVRVERDLGAAVAGELRVTLYPSDSFLRFAAAVAGNLDLGIIKKASHSEPPCES